MTFNSAQKEIFEYSDLIIANSDKLLIKAYREAYNNISDQLKNLYLKIQAEGIPKDEYYNYMTQYNRLERLQQSIFAEYNKAYSKQKLIHINTGSSAMTETFYRKIYLYEWTKDAQQLFVVLDNAVIEQSVLGTAVKWGDLVETYGLRNQYVPQANTLLDILKKNRVNDLAKIQQTLTQGFLQGTSYTKQAANFKELLGGSTYNATRIARTEGTRVMNSGSLASVNVARANGVDAKRQWLDTGDARTRQSHVNADGQKEDENGLFHVGGAVGSYPGNMSTAAESVNCRCTTIDIIDGVSPQLRRATNPLTGESDIISFDSFPEYMEENGMKLTAAGWVKK